jgi:hypothetical protein
MNIPRHNNENSHFFPHRSLLIENVFILQMMRLLISWSCISVCHNFILEKMPTSGVQWDKFSYHNLLKKHISTTQSKLAWISKASTWKLLQAREITWTKENKAWFTHTCKVWWRNWRNLFFKWGGWVSIIYNIWLPQHRLRGH